MKRDGWSILPKTSIVRGSHSKCWVEYEETVKVEAFDELNWIESWAELQRAWKSQKQRELRIRNCF